MSLPRPPHPAKLVIGILLKDKALVHPVAEALVGLFGSMDTVSPWLDFNFTDYYASEMGAPLFRRLFSFQKLIAQQDLPEIKVRTNLLERSFEDDRKRRVNIDPGYLLLERFVLATGKNFAHRIYLDKGIYADLTLIYRGGDFQTLPWTYPDYAHTDVKDYLKQVRMRFGVDLKRTVDA